MRVGAPFNPYKVFQGAFAPFWLLEHRGLSAGAKLGYIRLLAFAGKDGRCYPSLETLGKALGVSDRQARDYVKELERAGLIVVEHRGLRKTNVYLFVWTAELERLIRSVHDIPDGPEGEDRSISSTTPADRNSSSVQDRNSISAPDRNSSSGLIGISSLGIGSMESSSFSAAEKLPGAVMRKRTNSRGEHAPAVPATEVNPKECSRTTGNILRWVMERRVQRLRADRTLGRPEKDLLTQWAEVLDGLGIASEDQILSVLDIARAAADRAGDWRSWSFLTLQIQLAAERISNRQPPTTACREEQVAEDAPDSEWTSLKAEIRTQIGEIPFANWFDRTIQNDRDGTVLTVVVPDDLTLAYLESEYRELIHQAAARIGIEAIRFVVR